MTSEKDLREAEILYWEVADMALPQPLKIKKIAIALAAARAEGAQSKDDEEINQEGITYALERLAETVGAKDWHIQDGTETVEGDVDATIRDILTKASIIDDWNGEIARHNKDGLKCARAEARDDNQVAINKRILEAEECAAKSHREAVSARRAALEEAANLIEKFSVTIDGELTELFLKKNAAKEPSNTQLCYGTAIRALKDKA